MPRPKLLRIKIDDLPFGASLKSGLGRMKELADFDLDSVELVIRTKSKPYIADVERAISNLRHYTEASKHLIPTFEGEQFISKKLLARMMRVSRPTLDRWITAGFVTPGRSHLTGEPNFSIREVEEQLRAYQHASSESRLQSQTKKNI